MKEFWDEFRFIIIFMIGTLLIVYSASQLFLLTDPWGWDAAIFSAVLMLGTGILYLAVTRA